MRLLDRRMISIQVLLLLALCGVHKPEIKWVLAEHAPPILQSVLDNQDSLREQRITRLELMIERYENALKESSDDGSRSGREARKTAKAMVAAWKKEIADIKADRVIVISDKPPELIDEIGKIEYAVPATIVDEENAILSIGYDLTDYTGAPANPQQLIAWYSGPTANWTNQKIPDLPIYAYGCGIRKYKANSGEQMSVIEIKPFKMDCFVRKSN